MNEEGDIDVNEVNSRLVDLQTLQKLQEEEVRMRLREFQLQSPEECKTNQDRQFHLYKERQSGISVEYKRLKGQLSSNVKSRLESLHENGVDEAAENSVNSGSKMRSQSGKSRSQGKQLNQKESSQYDDVDDRLKSNHFYRVFGRQSYPLDQSLTDSDGLSTTSESHESVELEQEGKSDVYRHSRNRAWSCSQFNALTKPGIMTNSVGGLLMTLSLVLVLVSALIFMIMHYSHREITTMYIGPTLKTGYYETVFPQEQPPPSSTAIYANQQGLGLTHQGSLEYTKVLKIDELNYIEHSVPKNETVEQYLAAQMAQEAEDAEFLSDAEVKTKIQEMKEYKKDPTKKVMSTTTDSTSASYGHYTGQDISGMPFLAVIRPKRMVSVVWCLSLTCDEHTGVDISFAQYSLIVADNYLPSAERSRKQKTPPNVQSQSLPRHPRVQMVRSGTSTLILLSTPSNYLILIVCAKNSCKDNVSVVVLSETCHFSSITMSTTITGITIIGFQDNRFNIPCIITCTYLDCSKYERTCIRGVQQHDNSRLQVTSVPTALSLNVRSQITDLRQYRKPTSPATRFNKRELGSIAFTTYGRWTGALVTASNFVTRHINETIASRVFEILLSRGYIDSFGAITASFNHQSFDYPELFHVAINGGVLSSVDGSYYTQPPLYNEDKIVFDSVQSCPYSSEWATPTPDPITQAHLEIPLSQWKFELGNILRQFRGLPLANTVTSNSLLIYVYCHLPTCEPGYVTIAIPWLEGDNISDTGMIITPMQKPSLFVLRQVSIENYGVFSGIVRINCDSPDCVHNENSVGGASSVAYVHKYYSTYSGRFEIVHSPELETDNPMYLLLEHKGVSRVQKCSDHTCQNTLMLRKFNEEVCPLYPCFHMHVSHINSFPIFLHGTAPIKMTKHANNYLLPYVVN